jgi:hypothetical protein
VTGVAIGRTLIMLKGACTSRRKVFVYAIDRDGQICAHDRAIVKVTLIDGTAPTSTESPGPIAWLCGQCQAVGFKTPTMRDADDVCVGFWGAAKCAIEQRAEWNGGPSTGLGILVIDGIPYVPRILSTSTSRRVSHALLRERHAPVKGETPVWLA